MTSVIINQAQEGVLCYTRSLVMSYEFSPKIDNDAAIKLGVLVHSGRLGKAAKKRGPFS